MSGVFRKILPYLRPYLATFAFCLCFNAGVVCYLMHYASVGSIHWLQMRIFGGFFCLCNPLFGSFSKPVVTGLFVIGYIYIYTHHFVAVIF